LSALDDSCGVTWSLRVRWKASPWRAHLRDPDSYWITVSQAADILGVSDAELRRMLTHRRLPFFTHKSGVRLMRRRQIEEIAAHSHLAHR